MPNYVVLLLLVLFLVYGKAVGQLQENFNDGNHTANPAWVGNTGDFIVNSAHQLQSNNTTANSTFYISTGNTLATGAEWQFIVRLTFNTSAANYADVFVVASAENITLPSTTGYFVRIGGTDDEIALYRKSAGGTITKIIDGVNGITDASTNEIRIKLTRSATNQWILYRDNTSTGNQWTTEGTAFDNTFTTSAFFGILIRQSSSSFFQKHFFDDIEVKPFVPDLQPPLIKLVQALTAYTVQIQFSEEIEKTTAENTGNYQLLNGAITPVLAVKDATNPQQVIVTFNVPLASGVTNNLLIKQVRDLWANTIKDTIVTFSYYVPQPYSVLIHEIFADPTPPILLPEAEFIELINTSGHAINLQGFTLKTGSNTSGSFPAYWLLPDSMVVLTSAISAALYSPYGKVLPVPGFPALNNTGALLWLTSKENRTIHAVAYNTTWYQNAVKSEGGWSLEMIDATNPCQGAGNWKASSDVSGGTPGSRNSVTADNKDTKAPQPMHAYAKDSVSIELLFDEPLDSINAANANNYVLGNYTGRVIKAAPLPPLFNEVLLTISDKLTPGEVYTLTVRDIRDCSSNVVAGAKSIKVALPLPPDSLDVVINEILFNPKPGGVDYVELYNKSKKAINIKNLFIATRSVTTGQILSPRGISTTNLLLFPGEYLLVSENETVVQQHYPNAGLQHFINVSMPSLPDDEGIFVLLSNTGAILDELHYYDDWHFALLANKEGVALERIDYNRGTQEQNNWHSAASTSGFGTPARQNSQYSVSGNVPVDFVIMPQTFSPDNDGFEDFTIAKFTLQEPGFVANITIFDAAGRPVKVLAKNATLAHSSSFKWDGLDDKMQKVPVGIYIVFSEIFNLQGQKKTYKKTVVVASKW